MGCSTILMPFASQYNGETKVLGVSQQIFLPVKDAAAISYWTDQRQTQICSAIDSVFQKLHFDEKLSKAFHDKVADNLALNHQSSESPRKDPELLRTMNSVFKNEECASIEGIYTLKFGEGAIDPGYVAKDKPATHDEVIRIPSRGITLTGTRANRLPKTLKSGFHGPTEAVHQFVWGSVDIWKLEV